MPKFTLTNVRGTAYRQGIFVDHPEAEVSITKSSIASAAPVTVPRAKSVEIEDTEFKKVELPEQGEDRTSRKYFGGIDVAEDGSIS